MLNEQGDFVLAELFRCRLIFLGPDAVVLHHRSENDQRGSRRPSLKLSSAAEHLIERLEIERRRDQGFLRSVSGYRDASAALDNRRA